MKPDGAPSPLTIRHALPADDLAPVYTPAEAAMPWNREQMLVAVVEERVVGIALFFDGGHFILWLQNIRIHPDYRQQGVGTRLLEAVVAEAGVRGCTALMGAASGDDYLAFLRRHGVQILETPCYLAIQGVPHA